MRILGKAVVTIIIFALVLELCARVDDYFTYDAPFLGTYNNELLRSYDAEGIRINIPNARFEKWQNNSNGFRGPEVASEKTEQLTRIVCMGTSETYGLYESADYEWPAQLSKIYSENPSIEVINSSTVGLPFVDYNRYLEKYVLSLDPDIVVIMVNPLSYFVRYDRMQKRKMRESERGGIPANSNRQAVQNEGGSIENFIPSFRILPKTKQTIKRFLPTEIVESYQKQDVESKINEMESAYLRGAEPLESVPVESIEQFKEDLLQLIDTLQGKEIQVVLTTYPSLLSDSNLAMYPIIFGEARRFGVEYSLEGMVRASHTGDSIIYMTANEQNVILADLNKSIPKNREHFADMVHLTDLGAQILAQELAHSLSLNK